MPLNRKNRVTNKKKMFTRKLYTFNRGRLVDKTLPDDESFPSQTIFITDGYKYTDIEHKIKNNTTIGCTCRKCGNYNEYAKISVNKEFICYSCSLIW